MIASPLRYSVLCALVFAGLAALATQGSRLGLLPALLLLPFVAWPAWLGPAYAATVARIDARSSLRDGENPWWAPLLGGALLRQVAAVPVAVLAAGSLGWMLVADARLALGWVALAALLNYVLAVLLASRTAALRPYARPRPVLRLSPLATAAVLTLVWAGLGPSNGAAGATLAERIAAEPRYGGSSTLLAWGVDWTGLLNGAQAWGADWAARQGIGPLAAAWRLGGAFAQFWLLGLALSGLLLPPGALRRILRPTAADEPPPVGSRRLAVASFALSFLLLATVTGAARLEAWAAALQHPVALAQAPGVAPPPASAAPARPGRDAVPRPGAPLAGLPTPSDIRLGIEAERIGDLACPVGTIAGIERLDAATRTWLAEQREELDAAARRGFAAMRGNVAGYLDWYYSLPAEYARTGHLLLGDIEDHLSGELHLALGQGDPLAPLATAVERMAGNPERLRDWRAERARLLGGCRDLALPVDDWAVTYTAVEPGQLLLAGPSVEALDLRARLGGASAAAAAGGLAGALVASAAGKLLAKEAFGLAAEAVAKFAVGKTAGWLGGAAAGAGAGAVGGSVVPGVGTAAGAVVGGVVGAVGAWVATDYVLLELEEAISREAFEREILDAIDQAEAEFLASLQ